MLPITLSIFREGVLNVEYIVELQNSLVSYRTMGSSNLVLSSARLELEEQVQFAIQSIIDQSFPDVSILRRQAVLQEIMAVVVIRGKNKLTLIQHENNEVVWN